MVVVGVQQGPSKDRSSETWSERQKPSDRRKRSRKANKVHKAYVPCNSDPMSLLIESECL